MTEDERLDIVNRIEAMFDSQLDGGDLLAALERLEDHILGDPSAKKRRALRADHTAEYWEKSGRPESEQLGKYWRKMAEKYRR